MSKGEKKKKFLVSKSYDAMYVPNTHYPLLDAFASSLPCQLAFQDQNSTMEGRNLDWYLKLTHTHLAKDRRPALPPPKPIPSYLQKVLALQDRSGKFFDLPSILRLLGLPIALKSVRNISSYEDWEVATAIVLAMIRQHTELFDELQDYHDKAVSQLSSTELVQEIRLLVEDCLYQVENVGPSLNEDMNLTHTIDQRKAYNELVNENKTPRSMSRSRSGSNRNSRRGRSRTTSGDGKGIRRSRSRSRSRAHSEDSDIDLLLERYAQNSEKWSDEDSDLDADEIDEEERIKQIEKQFEQPLGHNIESYFDMAFQSMENKGLAGNEESGQKGEGDTLSAASSPLGSGASSPAPMLKKAPSDFSFLRSKVGLLEVKVDFAKSKLLEDQVTQCGVKVVAMALEVERLNKVLFDVLIDCVSKYNTCELYVERYKTFDKLTALLGEGFEPSPHFDDWRKQGVPSFRHAVVDYFIALYELAMARLTYYECIYPIGGAGSVEGLKSLMRGAKGEKKTGNWWEVRYNGRDLTDVVLRSLDFLRRCRELVDWYGPQYFYLANILSLPLPPGKLLESMGLEEKIQELQSSLPHKRVGMSAQIFTLTPLPLPNSIQSASASPTQAAPTILDPYENAVQKFKRAFAAKTKDCAFNWPSLPDMSEITRSRSMYLCMIVMGVTSGKQLKEATESEIKFIQKISTYVGQDRYLYGEHPLPPPKILVLPDPALRCSRPPAPIKKGSTKRSTKVNASMTAETPQTAAAGGNSQGKAGRDSVFTVIRATNNNMNGGTGSGAGGGFKIGGKGVVMGTGPKVQTPPTTALPPPTMSSTMAKDAYIKPAFARETGVAAPRKSVLFKGLEGKDAVSDKGGFSKLAKDKDDDEEEPEEEFEGVGIAEGEAEGDAAITREGEGANFDALRRVDEEEKEEQRKEEEQKKKELEEIAKKVEMGDKGLGLDEGSMETPPNQLPSKSRLSRSPSSKKITIVAPGSDGEVPKTVRSPSSKKLSIFSKSGGGGSGKKKKKGKGKRSTFFQQLDDLSGGGSILSLESEDGVNKAREPEKSEEASADVAPIAATTVQVPSSGKTRRETVIPPKATSANATITIPIPPSSAPSPLQSTTPAPVPASALPALYNKRSVVKGGEGVGIAPGSVRTSFLSSMHLLVRRESNVSISSTSSSFSKKGPSKLLGMTERLGSATTLKYGGGSTAKLGMSMKKGTSNVQSAVLTDENSVEDVRVDAADSAPVPSVPRRRVARISLRKGSGAMNKPSSPNAPSPPSSAPANPASPPPSRDRVTRVFLPALKEAGAAGGLTRGRGTTVVLPPGGMTKRRPSSVK